MARLAHCPRGGLHRPAEALIGGLVTTFRNRTSCRHNLCWNRFWRDDLQRDEVTRPRGEVNRPIGRPFVEASPATDLAHNDFVLRPRVPRTTSPRFPPPSERTQDTTPLRLNPPFELANSHGEPVETGGRARNPAPFSAATPCAAIWPRCVW